MSLRDLIEGYGAEKKEPKKYEPTEEEKRLLEENDLDKLSSRVKLRLAYLKARIESQEPNCDENGNPNL